MLMTLGWRSFLNTPQKSWKIHPVHQRRWSRRQMEFLRLRSKDSDLTHSTHWNKTKEEQEHLRVALKKHAATQTGPSSRPLRNETPRGMKREIQHHSISIPNLSGKLRRIFQKHDVLVHFKHYNTLRENFYTWRRMQGSIHQRGQFLHKRMAQQRRATSSGQDSDVHLHLKETGQFLRTAR